MFTSTLTLKIYIQRSKVSSKLLRLFKVVPLIPDKHLFFVRVNPYIINSFTKSSKYNYYQIFLEKLNYPDHRHSKIQTQDHETYSDFGPQNTYWSFFKTLFICVYHIVYHVYHVYVLTLLWAKLLKQFIQTW